MTDIRELIKSNPVLTQAEAEYEKFRHLQPGEQLGYGVGLEVRVLHRSGKEYAHRQILSPGFRFHAHAGRLSALALGLGRPGLEQLCALSVVDDVIITERMCGKSVEYVELEAMESMQQSQFDELARTIDTSTRNGIAIDESEGNLFYDPGKGFGLIDYGMSSRAVSTGRLLKGIGQAMMWLGSEAYGFNSSESIKQRERAIRMVTQSAFAILSQGDARAVAEASDEWIERCYSGRLIVDAE